MFKSSWGANAQAMSELTSAITMNNQGSEDDADLNKSTSIYINLCTTKATACMLDKFDKLTDLEELRSGTIAELRELRAKCDAKEETLLHPVIMKRARAALNKKTA
jgi:hypothetical protein